MHATFHRAIEPASREVPGQVRCFLLFIRACVLFFALKMFADRRTKQQRVRFAGRVSRAYFNHAFIDGKQPVDDAVRFVLVCSCVEISTSVVVVH